ncbi:MAG TPA: LysM peptidoglycan-binding domain-containing protein [Gaiellaceae bacterium]|nr:LysM peptidoglycan-binding domain-containing protein [Gaiellaceae bacterium]
MFALRWYLLALLLVGLLALTAPRQSSGAGAEARYVVRPGDTLWRLAAERYGGDPREGVWLISERNGLAGANLRPGMILYLPARGGDA